MPWMVKYQDTDAYKKATDEQLRHRDALEKEIRQREADKIQREAWRLDAIDRARAQLVPPVGVTGPPQEAWCSTQISLGRDGGEDIPANELSRPVLRRRSRVGCPGAA